MDNRHREPTVNWRPRALALGIVALTAFLAPWALIRSERVDSAALFVGVPLVIAVAVVLAPAAKSLHGLTFRVVTFCLLITSAYLHEGAACVLMAAPLVYAVAHFVAQMVQLGTRPDDRRRSALLVVPLLLLASLEGVFGFRAAPEQTVSEERTVAATPTAVERRLAQGPRFGAAARPRLLRITGYPTPTDSAGPGLAVGARWTITMAGGPIVTQVVERSPRRVVFEVLQDSSKTQRWLTWRRATLTWRPDGSGTAVRIEASFIRRLDPSWYFGPVESAMVDAGLDHFTDALGLVEGPSHAS